MSYTVSYIKILSTSWHFLPREVKSFIKCLPTFCLFKTKEILPFLFSVDLPFKTYNTTEIWCFILKVHSGLQFQVIRFMLGPTFKKYHINHHKESFNLKKLVTGWIFLV